MTLLQKKAQATGRRERKSVSSLVEQKRKLDETTRQTVGLASRAYSKTLRQELAKIKVPAAD